MFRPCNVSDVQLAMSSNMTRVHGLVVSCYATQSLVSRFIFQTMEVRTKGHCRYGALAADRCDSRR